MIHKQPLFSPRLFCISFALILDLLLLSWLAVSASANESTAGILQETVSNANAAFSESALGDLAADALRYETGSQVAIVFSGDLDLYLLGGSVTVSDVEAAIPRNTDYSLTAITAAELHRLLEDSFRHLVLTDEETLDLRQSASDCFPQVSGMKLRVDASAPAGKRIMELVLDDGSRLEADDSATILTAAIPTEALAAIAGASGQSCGGIRDIFLRYLAQNSPLEKSESNRILIVGAHMHSLISSISVFGLILIMCAVLAIPMILNRKPDPEARRPFYRAGIYDLKKRMKTKIF